MAQKLIQTQTQKQTLQQRLSQQQILQVKLLEMSLAELEQSVDLEIDDNPALEKDIEKSEEIAEKDDASTADSDDGSLSEEEQNEREERDDELEKALESIGGDDEMPSVYSHGDNDNAEYEEMIYGDTTSFYDLLKEQMGYTVLTPKEKSIMEYLIGSLDGDGLLRKSIDTISDELAIYNYVEASPEEITAVLRQLQTFDPAGIGAQSLQECLLLQIERRSESRATTLMREVVADHFDDFKKNRWDKIRQDMHLTDTQAKALSDEIRKLNPKPGASLGETEGRNMQQITPDFIIDTAYDGSVSFTVCGGNVPELKVSESFADMIDTYVTNRDNMSRQDKEALLYAKEKVDKAKGYIEALKVRRHTLYVTMKSIIEWQHKFFEDGDESELRPMILKDIADKTGLDISTISRVSNKKYAQTKWGIFPLRHFFTDSYTTDTGEEMSTRKIKVALKEIIDGEDKQRPMSDDALTKAMESKGFPVARRTVAKYREQMGIPVARLRRTITD